MAVALLLTLPALVILKIAALRIPAAPSTAAQSVKEDVPMGKTARLTFAATFETIHAVGAGGWAGCLLSKTKRDNPRNLKLRSMASFHVAR